MTSPTPSQLHHCSDCASWKRLSEPRMPDHGSCKHRPAGHYSHQSNACLFSPSKWSAKQ